MKYTYAYKTPDGVRHEAVMDASSREEVFETLRGRGIKAIKVVAADGSKANGEVRGVRARMVAVLVALAATVAGAAAWWLSARAIQGEGGRPREPHGNVPTDNGGGAARVTASSSPRHQIYGDPAVMEAFERGEFAKELPREGDRLLAVFAQPGRLMCPRGANPRKLAPGQAAAFEAYARDELSVERDVEIRPDEPREIRELKEIVNGMRGEMRAYLANGNGTPRSYWRRLNERALQEAQIYERTRRELEKESSQEVWDGKNAALRRLGIRTIPTRE